MTEDLEDLFDYDVFSYEIHGNGKCSYCGGESFIDTGEELIPGHECPRCELYKMEIEQAMFLKKIKEEKKK